MMEIKEFSGRGDKSGVSVHNVEFDNSHGLRISGWTDGRTVAEAMEDSELMIKKYRVEKFDIKLKKTKLSIKELNEIFSGYHKFGGLEFKRKLIY